jgi:hypothetical protein
MREGPMQQTIVHKNLSKNETLLQKEEEDKQDRKKKAK